MNVAVGRNTAIPFGARSLLAFVLEPKTPLAAWLEGLDEWLARSPNFFSAKPVMLQMAGVDISLKDYRDFLGQLAIGRCDQSVAIREENHRETRHELFVVSRVR